MLVPALACMCASARCPVGVPDRQLVCTVTMLGLHAISKTRTFLELLHEPVSGIGVWALGPCSVTS